MQCCFCPEYCASKTVQPYSQIERVRDEVVMCTGGRLIADFVVGTAARPDLPELAEERLTTTVDGLWVVWAYKLARRVGDLFVPLNGGPGYPADARATCRRGNFRSSHDAPDPDCTCGFHAVSSSRLHGLPLDQLGF